jgi:arabinan endo-1,5-alpha-L-arabinosidase
MPEYTNPIYGEYFADPFVWRCGREYFAIGTGRLEAAGVVAAADQATIFPLLQSSDLIHWRYAGRALIRPDASLGDTFWAPEVVFANDEWLLYYSVGHEDRMHQIRLAKSKHPLGPYVDHVGLTDLNQCAFAIDPHPFRDDDGSWYLFHARDFLDSPDAEGQPVRAGTALVVHALHSMTELSASGRTVARARFDWQRFASNRSMYGRVFDWHTLEGPCVIKYESRYYCLYSAGCWQTETYGVDYVVADTVLGPYWDEGAERGPRILRTVPKRVLGPGHCSVVRNTHGTGFNLFYHAWDANMTARLMCMDALTFSAQGPRSSGPTWTAQALGATPAA